MTSRDFCYWLQGYFELARASPDGARVNMNAAQVELVQKHLALVFTHEIDPSAGGPEHQAVLNAVHGNKPVWPNGIGTEDPANPGTILRC